MFNISAIFTVVLELHSVAFCQVKVYFKVYFEVQKFGSHVFSCQLLLGTNVPNDIVKLTYLANPTLYIFDL